VTTSRTADARRFVIEDDFHAEVIGQYATSAEANSALKALAGTPWDHAPNLCPCGNQDCGREYQLIEYDVSNKPWREIERSPALNVSRRGVEWLLP
jgi:hypothetical protein